MNVLYIGDIMGDMGIAAVEHVLPELKREKSLDLVVAQAENLSDGKGVLLKDYQRLRAFGVDVCTGGDHSIDKPEVFPLFEDSCEPIIGPANMSECPGSGYVYVPTAGGQVLVVSLLGSVVGRHADRELGNPLQTIDRILHEQIDVPRLATIVNFHGDYSSEKLIMGHYLDGRATLVVGDHWHIPTADAGILPKGTAHVTDVGMCGSLDSSLGVKFSSVVPRWRDGYQTRNELETTGRSQFNAVYVQTNDVTGKVVAVEHIRRVW